MNQWIQTVEEIQIMEKMTHYKKTNPRKNGKNIKAMQSSEKESRTILDCFAWISADISFMWMIDVFLTVCSGYKDASNVARPSRTISVLNLNSFQLQRFLKATFWFFWVAGLGSNVSGVEPAFRNNLHHQKDPEAAGASTSNPTLRLEVWISSEFHWLPSWRCRVNKTLITQRLEAVWFLLGVCSRHDLSLETSMLFILAGVDLHFLLGFQSEAAAKLKELTLVLIRAAEDCRVKISRGSSNSFDREGKTWAAGGGRRSLSTDWWFKHNRCIILTGQTWDSVPLWTRRRPVRTVRTPHPSSRHSLMTFFSYGVFRWFPQDSSTAVGLMEPITRWSGFSRFTLPRQRGLWDCRRLWGSDRTGPDQNPTCAVLLHVVDWDWLDGHQVLWFSIWNKMVAELSVWWQMISDMETQKHFISAATVSRNVPLGQITQNSQISRNLIWCRKLEHHEDSNK